MILTLADGNITIYRSIYPVSLAYQKGGIEEVRRIGAELKATNPKVFNETFKPMLDAYEQTDKGIKLNKRAPGTGDSLITDGTNAIIEFEQRVVAQPFFDRNPKLVYAMGLFAFGDLDADDNKIDWKTFSTFQQHHLAQDFGNPDSRIDWINEVFIKWDEQRTERFDEVREQMQGLTDAGRAAGGRY